MTRGIEDMLGIPHLDDILKAEKIAFEEEVTRTTTPDIDLDQQLTALQEIDENIKTSEGLDHARAMDEVYEETLEHSRNLMDLGFNTDERSRRGIFEIATSMYKNALDAKNSKRDSQLKLMKLIQDQRKQDFEETKWRASRGENLPGSTGTGITATLVEDRNALIRRLREDINKEEQNVTEEPDTPGQP